MWRLDRAWKKLRDEVPYLKRLPSESIREHFWMTTQPIEEPPKPEYFQQLLEHINADERLMFCYRLSALGLRFPGSYPTDKSISGVEAEHHGRKRSWVLSAIEETMMLLNGLH